jgi:amino acid transporter
MEEKEELSAGKRLRRFLIGSSRDPEDKTLFHKLSLIAFFAWVALGADGMSSSSYGPEEAFRALSGHHALSLFVALGTAITIFVISTSYNQIIQLFPSGGGGYLVASKLLSPKAGMVAGCALLIDYVLTITLSIASGADALFSFLPTDWHHLRLEFALVILLILIILNLRGVKESVIPLIPIFILFVLTHMILIGYAWGANLFNLPAIVSETRVDFNNSVSELGMFGVMFLILRAYSMGAGTFTGIEAVSNGLPILREPKVETAKRTMRYMTISLALLVLGLMFSYLLYGVQPQQGKTLNAILFESITATWGSSWGYYLVLIALLSEAALLTVAAQTGFIDGPRVLSNMALDRWMPTRFATLSDRLVTQNGIVIMGVGALILMIATRGSVQFLVVLYSINVFITFVLSQSGMVRHWWLERKQERYWKRKLVINGVGLILTSFILVSVIVLKFFEGGWITLLVTGGLVATVLYVKRHYLSTQKLLKRLDTLVNVVETSDSVISPEDIKNPKPEISFNKKAKTAVILVNGFNGLGLHTLFSVIRYFGDTYKNYLFVEVGIFDAGNFKGAAEIDRLQAAIKLDVDRYINYMKQNGYYAEGFTGVGIDVVEEISNLSKDILAKYPSAVFFGGQLVFGKESILSRWLHNYTVFSLQRKFYHEGVPVVILPIRVY